jgi:sorbitol/mannitol transport system permease protein
MPAGQRLVPSVGGLGMAVGGLLVAVGSLFPWFDVLGADPAVVPVAANKTEILVAGVVTFCAALLYMWQRPRFHLMSVVGIGSTLVALILVVELAFNLQAASPKPLDLTSVLQWGYWLSLFGALISLFSAYTAFREKEPRPRVVRRGEDEPTSLVGKAGRWITRNYLIAPAIIYAVVLTQGPFLLTIWYSLQKWNLLRPENSRFNGLQNYVDLLSSEAWSPDFFNALINTVILTAFVVILSLILGLFFADLVNHRFPGRGIVRTLLITPFLVMPVVGALAWKNMMLNPVFGVVDWVITSLGGPRIDWFTDYPMESIIIIVVWRWAPFMMLIMLAGMQALSDEVREAGRVDGATTWQEFRFIVLPHLRPFMQLCILFGTIYVLAEFDSIAMTTQGGPGKLTMNLPYLIYRTLFYSYDVGHSAAMGVILVIVTIIFATYLIRLLGRLMETSK